ncbi:Cytochrome [Forsythia ovata]|uniref:Cytochrome n=1 Tax=Forsythia ovata TaxID=205694 RepID=A0ABD1WR07_9LAMI
MDFLTIVLGLLFALTFIQAFRAISTRGKNMPPGPAPLPIIGNLHLLGDQPHKSLSQLAKIYGPIMGLRFGSITTVVITSPALAKEVLQKQDLAFSSRHVPNAIHAHNHFQYSVVWLPAASKWRSLRKVLNSNIFSGNRLDANQYLRVRKVQELIAYCRKSSQAGETVDVGRAAFRTSLNLLSNTIFSKDLTDPFSDSAKEFKDLVWNMMVETGKPNLVDFFPVLRKLDPQGIRRRMTIYLEKMISIFDDLINERLHRRKSLKSGNSDDVLDVLLDTSEESPEEIDRVHIKHLCLVCFFFPFPTPKANSTVIVNTHTHIEYSIILAYYTFREIE